MTTKISKICIATIILFTFIGLSFAGINEWGEYKSDHFIISYHPGISTAYIRTFSRKCEQYYGSIAERLGLRRFDFWTWDNRAKILVYDTRENYIKSRNRPAWSAASVYVKNKLISTYCFDEELFDSILAHEIAHIVLRELIGLDTEVPLWFDEGVACVNEQGCYAKYLLGAKELLDKQSFMSVTKMEGLVNSQIKSKSYIPFYSMAASLVSFLLEEYSREDFVQLCRELRDGKAFYGALNKVYHIRDPQDLEAKFLTFLQEKEL